jgi:hypothetical protein
MVYNAIYRSSVDGPIAFETNEVAHELGLLDEEGEVEGGDELDFEGVDVLFGDASYFGVELVFVIEVIKILSSDHNGCNQKSEVMSRLPMNVIVIYYKVLYPLLVPVYVDQGCHEHAPRAVSVLAYP